MKLTNNSIIAAIMTINKCADAAIGKTAYAMRRNRQILQTELVSFNETKEDLFKKYGTKDKNGVLFIDQNAKAKYDAFQKELAEVLNIELDVELWQIETNEFNLEFVGNITLRDYDVLEALLVKNASK